MAQRNPTFSIVVIANESQVENLPLIIKSIEGQSRQPLERVLVFDSEETYYLREWICLNGYWNELASSINFAVSNTKADYLVFIDAKRSSIPQNFTSTILNHLIANNDSPMIQFGDFQIWKAETIISLGCWKGSSDDMVKLLKQNKIAVTSIEGLKESPPHPHVRIETNNKLNHAVVITNYKRPQMLRQAFDSCMQAKVHQIVVTSSGADSSIKQLHQQFLREKPNTIIVTEDGDSGVNKNWIAGVNAAPADFVTLLHDDDKLNPSFNHVQASLRKDVGFIAWDGSKHGSGSEHDGFYEYFPFLKEGIHDARLAFEALIKKDGLTLSPVGGAFRKEQMLRTLNECEKSFSGPEFHIKPTMMVGNDHLLWLRAAQQNSKFRYIKKQLVSYGHHEGSASFDDAINNRGRLLPIYQRVREYFLKDFPKIFHVVPRYDVKNSATKARIAKAEFTWNRFYKSGLVHPVHIWEKDYKRTSLEIGDNRKTPFLKDILQAGLDRAQDNDYVMITNDDTMLHPLCLWAVYSAMMKEEVCCSFRVSFDKDKMPALDADPEVIGKTGFFDKGRDLFAMRKKWLANNIHRIPDYVIGSTDWDSTLGIAFRKWRDIPVSVKDYCLIHPRSEIPLGYVYHENHVAFWCANQKRREHVKGNIHNREQSMKFIRENGVGWVI